MLDFDELVNKINQLSLSERPSLLEVLTKSVKNEITQQP
jgi:hypothetical protein